jgi:hypothetical protein
VFFLSLYWPSLVLAPELKSHTLLIILLAAYSPRQPTQLYCSWSIKTGSRCDARLPGFAQKDVEPATQVLFGDPGDQESLSA